jgi:hypothetical protein
MKLFHFVLLFLMLSYKAAIAQVVTVSEEISIRTDDTYQIIGRLNNQYLILFSRENLTKVQAFNDDFRMVWDKELELDKRRPVPIGIVANTNDFFLVYEFKNKGESVVKVHKYNASANLIDSVTLKNFGFQFITPSYELLRSDDRSKILLHFIQDQKEVHAVSFDLNTMKVLWETAFTVNDLYQSREEPQVLVDNKGRMYFTLSKDNFRSKNKEHTYDIFSYTSESTSPQINIVSFRDSLTYDIQFEYDNLNETLKAGGLYGDRNIAWAKGYFFLTIPSKNPAQYQLYFHEFTDELVEKFLAKDATSKNRGIFDTEVQEIILRRDGGILMIAEKVKISQRGGPSGLSTVPYYYNRNATSNLNNLTDYYFDQLLVLSIHPDGEKHWENVLHKKQYSQDDNGIYSSYFLLKNPGNLQFIFNDEVKEENTVSEYALNGDGTFERHSIMSTDNQRIRVRFRDALQISTKEIIMPSERRSRVKLVRIRFE